VSGERGERDKRAERAERSGRSEHREHCEHCEPPSSGGPPDGPAVSLAKSRLICHIPPTVPPATCTFRLPHATPHPTLLYLPHVTILNPIPRRVALTPLYRPCERCVKYGLNDCIDSTRKPRKTGVKR
jgi:hypothetical protein